MNLSSTFIEVINETKYKYWMHHPKTIVNEFTNDFMLLLLEKLSLEKRDNANG